MKDQDYDPMDSDPKNPYHALISQLTGKDSGRPRRKTAVNVWRKTQRHQIETKVKALAAAEGVARERLAALRDKVARDMYNALPADKQEFWRKQADEESELAIQQWKRSLNSEPSGEAVDRQLYVLFFATSYSLSDQASDAFKALFV